MVDKNKNREDFWFKTNIVLNVGLVVLLAIALIAHFAFSLPYDRVIFIVLAFLGLIPVLKSALGALYNRQLTIDLLASIALVFCFLAKEWHSAAFINLMLASARIFYLWTKIRERNIISHLLKYRPTKVKIKKGEEIFEIPIEEIKIGDLVVVESGDRLPVDGRVIFGQASINEAVITGESELTTKRINDYVLSSTLNEAGSLVVRAEKIGEDSTFSKIIAMIEEASKKKSKNEQMAARFAAWYIVIVLFGALALWVTIDDIQLVLSVLLVACADDIAVAIPLGFTMAIARAARRGVLIKGADIIENLTKIKYFVSDKTGTLTTGRPKIKKTVVFSGDEEGFLRHFGLAEINSCHPTSVAIIKYLKEKSVEILAPDEFHETPGDGIEAIKNGVRFFAGKVDFLEKNGVTIKQEELSAIKEQENNGYSVTSLGLSDGAFLGFMALEDEVRPMAATFIAQTKSLGVKSWIILTGDNERVAAKVAKELQIKHYQANLKPKDKLAYVENFKKDNPGVLAMVGDGVNDAAALALADVSIAMGIGGSDATIEAADITLVKDNLEKVPEVILLGHATMEIIKQNFWLWGALNALGLVLVFAGFLNPVGAAAFNFATDFVPILNALRVGIVKIKRK